MKGSVEKSLRNDDDDNKTLSSFLPYLALFPFSWDKICRFLPFLGMIFFPQSFINARFSEGFADLKLQELVAAVSGFVSLYENRQSLFLVIHLLWVYRPIEIVHFTDLFAKIPSHPCITT